MKMQINAVTDSNAFSISAAMASREVIGIRSLMAAAGLEPKGRMSTSELDAVLRDSRLSVLQRLELKLALSKSGILI
jgi:hypothetical protein